MGIVAAGVVVLLVRDNGASDPNRAAEPATMPTMPPSGPATSTGARQLDEPLTTEPVATSLPVPTPVTPLVRPVTDPDICVPISAEGGSASGLPRSPSSNLPLTLFARPSAMPIPIQIIGEPVDGPAKPFALVERFFDSDRPPTPSSEPVTIGGVEFFVGTYLSGNGEVTWNLPDGSQGYVRSRGLDRDTLVAIVSALTPRATDTAIPGFDYATSGPSGLELVAEQMNTEPWGGAGAGSQCRVSSTGYVYRISAYQGDPVWEFGAVIDRPPPVDVGVIDDTVVVISGLDDPTAPTVADVTDADEATWRRLLIEPGEPWDFPQPIGGDVAATAELVPIDDTSTPVSSLTFRVDVQDGVAFFEIYTTDAVIAEQAEYWKIEIDGRIRSRSTAGSGGVMGVRLADAPLTEPFTATVSTTDGDDFTIQTTGPILLSPVTV